MSPFDLLSVLNWTLFFYCLKLHDICTCVSSKIEWAYSIIKKNGEKSNGSLRLEINETWIFGNESIHSMHEIYA